MNSKTAIKQLEELKKQTPKKLRLAAEKWKHSWKTLISTILSARTRDETTIKVSLELYKKYPTIKQLSNASIESIQKTIKPINFYKNKSKNILNYSNELIKNHKGIPSHDFNKLINLPGVGRKTANVFLSEIGYNTIGVDTHVSCISQKLEWTNNKNPIKIESDLKNLFPKKYWKNINPILVRFGKTYISKKKDEILDNIKKIK